MHYVIADVHGEYSLFQKMLEKIHFSDADTLYLLGDMIDRGPDGIPMIQNTIHHPNMIPFWGNHEDMFCHIISNIGKKLSLLEKASIKRSFYNWTVNNGGDVTWDAYRSLTQAKQAEIIAYLKTFHLHLEITVNNRTFLLVHAGVGTYEPEKPLSDCTRHDFIWERMDYDSVYYQNKYLVTGHTPTGLIDPAFSHRIIQKNHHIAIDCGATFTGVLGCICLETLEEFYVK